MRESFSHYYDKKLNEQQTKTGNVSTRSVWTNPIHFICCGFGVGTLPGMPGTYGTFIGVLLFLIFAKLPFYSYVAVAIAFNLAGIWLCHITNRDFGTDDHPATVFDEMAGFLIVMLGVPNTWYFVVIGFILFRIFDIWKPGPIGWLDRNVHGGLGVMLDDILAAVFSCIILQLIVWVTAS